MPLPPGHPLNSLKRNAIMDRSEYQSDDIRKQRTTPTVGYAADTAFHAGDMKTANLANRLAGGKTIDYLEDKSPSPMENYKKLKAKKPLLGLRGSSSSNASSDYNPESSMEK